MQKLQRILYFAHSFISQHCITAITELEKDIAISSHYNAYALNLTDLNIYYRENKKENSKKLIVLSLTKEI